jgi:hypothetical protein
MKDFSLQLSRPLAAGILVLGLALGLGLWGCSNTDRPASPGPILVIGIDGLEWDILQPLLARHELPHLATLMDQGVSGSLTTLEPTLSPVIWTTIATGKPPAEHGITNFTWQEPDGGATRLFTSRQRKVPALWTIASALGRTVDVVGWWNTWPAEAIEGRVVAQFSSLDQGKKVWKGTVHEGVPAQTWPRDLYDDLLPLVRQVTAAYPDLSDTDTINGELASLFPALPEGLTPFERRLVEDSIWAYRADATYTAIAENLMTETAADLTLVYLGSPDVAGHRFFRHAAPDFFTHKPRQESLAAFADVIAATYRFVDSQVGRLVAAAPAGTSVLIVSDHGMKPVNTDKDFEWAFENSERYRLAAVNSGHHLAGEPGVLIAAGPAFRSAPLSQAGSGTDTGATAGGIPLRRGTVFDMTPTLLHLLGLEVGRDMPGVVLTDLLAENSTAAAPIAYTSSHDTLQNQAQNAGVDGMDEERLRQLRSLGYVD